MAIEPNAVTKLRDEKKIALAAIKEREHELIAELTALVPPNLKKWAKKSEVVKNVVENGRDARLYGDCTFGVYGYTDPDEFAGRFDALRIAWSGVVNVDVSWNDREHAYSLIFTAV